MNTRSRSLKLLLIILLISSFHSQKSNAQILGRDLLKNRDKIQIPFRYIGGFIVVKVQFSEVLPLNFIVDTGAANTIIFERDYAEVLGAEYTDTIEVVGADITSHIEGYIVRNGSFKLYKPTSTTLKRDYIVLSENCVDIEERIGFKIDGILGSDFFKRLTIKIDYLSKMITLYNPEKFNPHKNDYPIKTKIVNGKPYIPVNVDLGNAVYKLMFLIDTGASLASIIHSNTDTLIQIPKGSLPSYLGTGLSGTVEGHIGLVNKLTIGKYSFSNLIANFQNIDNPNNIEIVRNGLLGSVLLSKFYVTIDYSNSIVYMRTNRNFKKEIKTDKSGLIIHAHGDKLNEFIVHFVYPTSAADNYGFKKGDIIKKINSCKAKSLSLNKIQKKFQKKAGKSYELEILRGDSILYKPLVLRELITPSKDKDN